MIRDFGPESVVTISMIKILYKKVESSKSSKVEALFNDWKRLFSQVCAYSPEKLKGLEREYEISADKVNYDALLFSLHTYYALLMKLLAAEVAYLFGAGKWLKSYIAELEDANMKGLDTFRTALEDLESGGVFRKVLNITNFIEGDYFSWYLEDLDTELASAIANLAKGLADYEPATSVLEPEYTRDLLKRLYQNLMPRKIRHDLGEYYTPDWLADLLLNEAGLTVESFEKMAVEKGDPTFPLSRKILDPACGSGTFLVLTIKRFREYAEEHYLKDVLSNYVLKNVVGFDLNPLAVLASRTNYLLAIADLLTYAQGAIEIPIYLADSIMLETRTTLTGISYAITTYVGVFELPKTIVDRGMLGRLLEVLDKYVRLGYRIKEFNHVVEKELDLNDEELHLVGILYKTFLKLEGEGRNHVWTGIIKNAFAPLTIMNASGKFHCVIGNPPWINWESLPADYREKSKSLWALYGLLKGKGAGLGKVKRELASLFVARSLDRFVDDKGKLAFLLPLTVFKAQSGAGFREFLAKGKPSNTLICKVQKVHDLVTLYPFEGATNRTALIILEKNEKTTFPIPCVIWHNSRTTGIDLESTLSDVEKSTKQFSLIFMPIEKNKAESPWIQITEEAYRGIKRVLGKNCYKGYAGVFTGLNQVYWINILDELPDGLLVRNPIRSGQKKEVKVVEAIVEKKRVYPSIRGRDIKKWYMDGDYGWIILPHDPKTGKPLSESVLKKNFPQTYSYFANFKSALEQRAIHRLWGKGNPFYSVYDIGSYTFYPYKIVWKEISGKISGKAEFHCCVIETPNELSLTKKPIIPDHKLMMIPFNDKEEAYYVAALLNSSITSLIISGSAIETAIDPRVIEHIKLKEFDPKNALDCELCELSKNAHLITKSQEKIKFRFELEKIEEKIDALVANIYHISEDELREIKKCMRILRGGQI